MAVRKALVLIDNQISELPSSDSLSGVSGGATALSFSYVDGELIVAPNDLYSFAITDGELIITYTGQG